MASWVSQVQLKSIRPIVNLICIIYKDLKTLKPKIQIYEMKTDTVKMRWEKWLDKFCESEEIMVEYIIIIIRW
jgi:hypothetical protein